MAAKNPFGSNPSLAMAYSTRVCPSSITNMTLVSPARAPAVIRYDAFLDRGLTKASYLITAGALAGLTSVMLVMLLGQTRVLYAMANDGLLPKGFFAAIHRKFRTPYKNTILVGLVAAIVGSLFPIEDIGRMVNIGTLLAFVIVCISVIVLRRTNPGQPRPFRTPWVPLVPLLGIGFNGYMMTKLGWINWARLIIWLIIGMFVYFGYSRHHSRVRANASVASSLAPEA